MDKNYSQELNIQSDAFMDLRLDFDTVLNKTLLSMEKKQSSQAEITVKLKLELRKEQVRDFRETRYEKERDVIKPSFSHKVTSAIQAKFEESGAFFGEYELVWDGSTGRYVMRDIKTNQVGFFDEDEADGYEYEEIEEE